MATNGGIDGYLFFNNKIIKTLDISSCAYNLYFGTNSFNGSTIETILTPSAGISIHVEESALANTKNLKSLTGFKLGVNSNTKSAFYGSAIEEIEIIEAKASNPIIGESMFEECKSLKEVSYPDSIAAFGKNAFKNCSSLEEIIIKSNVTSIGENCFDGCVNLSDISSYSAKAPTTVAYSFGKIGSHAGFNNRNKTDENGYPYNKLYIPASNSGYLSDEKVGLGGWSILTNSTYGNFEVNETL